MPKYHESDGGDDSLLHFENSRGIKSLDFYQQLANRTAPCENQLATFALGVAGEAGEVADLVKKYIGHGHPLDVEKLKLELGDVLWYVAGLASVIGVTLSEVANANIAKLEKRYPNGFSTEASMNRVDVVATASEPQMLPSVDLGHPSNECGICSAVRKEAYKARKAAEREASLESMKAACIVWKAESDAIEAPHLAEHAAVPR